tara:strand:- start:317 stop:532 length:216 start_codon:yes stop_codon:yes gene_type:complete
MKKLIMITAMFMAMNTWSASDYKVCETRNKGGLSECVNDYMNQGYQLHGGIFVIYVEVGTSWYYQSLIKFD